MVRTKEATGKTVEEARAAACALLGVSEDDLNVSYEVLEMPQSTGFLGLKKIPARVRVTVEEEDPAPVQEKPAVKAVKAEKTAKAEAVTTEAKNSEAAAWVSAGVFKVTHYCNCERCQGEYIGTTATGTAPKAGRTIAVDPDRIPLGSVVKIDGQEYVAEDTGGAIKGNRVDIFVADHGEAMAKGVKEETIYLKG